MFKSLWTLSALTPLLFGAFSSSSNYQLQSYGLGSGGTSSSASPSYNLNGSLGEVGGTPATGTNDKAGSGSNETRQANQPLAPTLSNGTNTFYNKLLVTINTSGSDASDYAYSIAVSTDNFVTTKYVQADGTLGTTAVYQTYATWGAASGSYIVGLSPNVTYKAKVDAMQAKFTNSAYGPTASATTANPSLTFSITPNTVSLGNLLPGTVISGSSNISFSFATNGAAGGAVYVAGANGGLKSIAANNTITSTTNDLSSQSQGFGLMGGSTGQTSGGPLTTASPYNGSANSVGALTANFQQLFMSNTAITGGSSSAGLKAKAALTTPAAPDYTETVTFIASASF